MEEGDTVYCREKFGSNFYTGVLTGMYDVPSYAWESRWEVKVIHRNRDNTGITDYIYFWNSFISPVRLLLTEKVKILHQ